MQQNALDFNLVSIEPSSTQLKFCIYCSLSRLPEYSLKDLLTAPVASPTAFDIPSLYQDSSSTQVNLKMDLNILNI